MTGTKKITPPTVQHLRVKVARLEAEKDHLQAQIDSLAQHIVDLQRFMKLTRVLLLGSFETKPRDPASAPLFGVKKATVI